MDTPRTLKLLRRALAGLLCTVVSLGLVTATATAETQADFAVVQQIPADAALAVVVPGLERLSDSIKGMIAAVSTQETAGDFDVLKVVPIPVTMGQGFDPSGSFAAVLLDPRKADPEYVKLAEAKQLDLDSPEEIIQKMPIVLIVPATDAKALFKEISATEVEGVLVYRHKDAAAEEDPVLYGKVTGRHVVLARNKSILRAWSNKVNILTRLTAGQGQAMVADQAWFWADRKLLAELQRKGLIPEDMSATFSSRIVGFAGPPAPILWYLHATRDEIFNEAESLYGGLRITDQALHLDARWSYPAGSQVGKLLAAFEKPAGPLIRNIPSRPGTMVYGADKSVFATPLSIKKAQYAKLLQRGPMAQLISDEDRKALVQHAADLQQQVLSVEHFFGPSGKEMDESSIAFATVVRCKSSKVVMEKVQALPELISATATKAGMPVSLQYKAQAEKIGRLDVAEVRINVPMMMVPELTKVLPVLIGDQKIRVYAVPIDRNTVVITFAGGLEFLKEMVETSRRAAATQLDPETRAVAAMLPANRAAEVFISPYQFLELYKSLGVRAYKAVEGQDADPGPMPTYTSKTPVAGAVVIEDHALRVHGLIPLSTIKGYVEMMEQQRKQWESQAEIEVRQEDLPMEVDAD